MTDKEGERHEYKGGKMERGALESFLQKFAAIFAEKDLHFGVRSSGADATGIKTQKVKVKKQGYSSADSENLIYPKGFHPWKALELPTGSSNYKVVLRFLVGKKCKLIKLKVLLIIINIIFIVSNRNLNPP